MQENVNIPDSTITTNLSFRQLVLMNMQQLTNFPYIEKDFDALTDYELLSLVVKYLNDVIDNQNEQNDSITRMYESFLALQTYVNNTKDTLEDAFNTLDDYVRNYFANLDVQDEIDHKLDEYVADGTLEHIIASYLQTQKIYNTHAEMIADASNLVNGLTVQTLGYYAINDGGGAFYKITDTASLTEYQESVGTLYATLIIDDYINPLNFGAYGDGTHDDTTAFSQACTLASSNNKQVFLSKNFKIDTLVLPYNTIITGGKLTLIGTLKLTRRNKILNTNIDVSNLGTESTGIALLISNENLIDDQRSEVTIDGVNFSGNCYCLIKLESKVISGSTNSGLYDNNITNITSTSTSEYGIIITAEEGAWSNTHLFNNVFLGTVKNTILMDNASAVFNNVASQAIQGSQYYATMSNASKGIFIGRSQMIDIGNFSGYQFNITFDCFVKTDIEYSTHLVAPIQNKTTDAILLNCFNIFSSTNININREYNLKRLSNNTYNDITGANIGGVIRDVFDKDNIFIGTKYKYGGYINQNYINPEYFIGIKNYKNNTSIFAPYIAIQSDSNSEPVFYEITSAFSGGAYASADRPANATAGAMIFDTTLNKPIWKYGTHWYDATGTRVDV